MENEDPLSILDDMLIIKAEGNVDSEPAFIGDPARKIHVDRIVIKT